MNDNDIISLWKKGLSKNLISIIYKREYNKQIKILRSNIRHKFDGNFINSRESLAKIEKIIYNYVTKTGYKLK